MQVELGNGPKMSSITRRKAVRTAAGATLAFAGVMGAAACGGPSATSGNAGGGTKSKQPVTLKLNYRTEMYIPTRAKQFTEQYPWISVDLLTDTGYEKLVTQIAAGDPGDVIWMSTGIGTYFEMAALGNLMNVEPLVAADKYD